VTVAAFVVLSVVLLWMSRLPARPPGGMVTQSLAGPSLSSRLPLPRVLRDRVVRRQRRAVERSIPAWCESIASSLRAGRSLRDAVAESVAVAGGPLRQEVGSLSTRVNGGAVLSSELARLAEAADVAAVRLATAAMVLGDELGGGRALALDRVAAVITDDLAFADEVASQSTTAVLSARVMVALPIVFGALSAMGDDRVADALLGSAVGRTCVLAAAVLDAVGLLWMRVLIRSAS
jgi:tight adherence protein B